MHVRMLLHIIRAASPGTDIKRRNYALVKNYRNFYIYKTRITFTVTLGPPPNSEI